MTSLYDFHAQSLDGKDVPLSDFKGQVVMVVNTASKCGFTPQYEGLEKLYAKHHAQGFTVLGFPCNQFGSQEPGSESEIGAFCQKNYGVSFPMFAKIDVNGARENPLYTFLKQQKRGFLGTPGIKWNFTKFLIDRAGKVIARYGSLTKPESLEAPVARLL